MSVAISDNKLGLIKCFDKTGIQVTKVTIK